MGWKNLIVGARTLHNFANAYINVINVITTFIGTTPPTNIITDDNILNQYNMKQGFKV